MQDQHSDIMDAVFGIEVEDENGSDSDFALFLPFSCMQEFQKIRKSGACAAVCAASTREPGDEAIVYSVYNAGPIFSSGLPPKKNGPSPPCSGTFPLLSDPPTPLPAACITGCQPVIYTGA